MNIIARYVCLSFKKNFAYKANCIFIILDDCLSLFSLWLFWSSLMELDVILAGWTKNSIWLFMGFSLIATAVSNLFVGGYDIQQHVQEGTLDNYLVKPCNSVLLILLERANFMRFTFTFSAGLIIVMLYSPFERIGAAAIGIGLCILSTIALELIVLAVYELVFWLKKVDTFADIVWTLFSIRQYPVVFFGKKVTMLLTYILPVAFVGTIPTELIAGESLGWSLPIFACLFVIIVALTYGLWHMGRRQYESAN